ncbi:MAG: GNAT family N-acetyltransferase [Anaerolineales bacterium]|nr:GNAT family N-acetyltransferase [Chloroflexota bacterium]MBL6982833.1 GNAT family N-acetyltransferase [Anaerolineales bacterium]
MLENRYVEMIYHLAEQPQIEISLPFGFEVKDLKHANKDELYSCYYAAFERGDARFFFKQSEVERREYFNTLCLNEARSEPGSSVILNKGRSISFTYILPYGEGNCHISCMCVHPDFQHQELGKFMLHHAIREVSAQGHSSITLGTDTKMSAFHLYQKHGFEIMEEKES